MKSVKLLIFALMNLAHLGSSWASFEFGGTGAALSKHSADANSLLTNKSTLKQREEYFNRLVEYFNEGNIRSACPGFGDQIKKQTLQKMDETAFAISSLALENIPGILQKVQDCLRETSPALPSGASVSVAAGTGIVSAVQPKTKVPNYGPLAKLGFQLEDTDPQGKLLGWLKIPQYKDDIYVRVTLYPNGYALDFITPTDYKALEPNGQKFYARTESRVYRTLSPGLFYWKSQKEVKEKPADKIYYLIIPHGPKSESGFWYKNTQFNFMQPNNYKLAKYETYPDYVPNPYNNVADLTAAFGGPYRAYDKAAQPIIKKIDKKMLGDYLAHAYVGRGRTPELWQISYKTVKNEKNGLVDFVLLQIPDHFKTIISQWINEKLKNSPYSAEKKEDIVRQFIFEMVKSYLRGADTIDLIQLLERIHSLRGCTQQMYDGMMKFLQDVHHTENLEDLTAVGLAECNPGLLQHD